MTTFAAPPSHAAKLLSHAIGDLRVARDPHQPFAAGDGEGRSEERLRTVRHRGVRDVTQVLSDAALAHHPVTIGERLDLARLGEQLRQRRQVGQT